MSSFRERLADMVASLEAQRARIDAALAALRTLGDNADLLGEAGAATSPAEPAAEPGAPPAPEPSTNGSPDAPTGDGLYATCADGVMAVLAEHPEGLPPGAIVKALAGKV